MRIREMNERLEVSKSQVIVEVRGGSGRDYKRTAMDSRLKANNLYLAVAELIT